MDALDPAGSGPLDPAGSLDPADSSDPFEAPDASEAVADPFDMALEAAIARLPERYRSQLATVAIVVADEPSAEELASTGAPGLLGLYRGVPRTALGAEHAAVPS